MTQATSYRNDYHVAFDNETNVIAHHQDKDECAKLAKLVADSFEVHTATRMTDAQFYDALEQVKPNCTKFIVDVGSYFCGRLVYHCNGMLFDQYGEDARRFGSTDVRFKLN